MSTDKSSKGAKNGHPSACEADSNPSSRPNADKAERMILSELADAVAFGAKVDRANELRDAMYLSVVARHCALGVPLVPEVEAFQGSRGSSRGSALFGGSVSGRGVGGGGGRRTGAHDRKVSRLVRECLPTGADELIERHIDRIISDVEAFGLSDGALAGAYREERFVWILFAIRGEAACAGALVPGHAHPGREAPGVTTRSARVTCGRTGTSSCRTYRPCPRIPAPSATG